MIAANPNAAYINWDRSPSSNLRHEKHYKYNGVPLLLALLSSETTGYGPAWLRTAREPLYRRSARVITKSSVALMASDQ